MVLVRGEESKARTPTTGVEGGGGVGVGVGVGGVGGRARKMLRADDARSWDGAGRAGVSETQPATLHGCPHVVRIRAPPVPNIATVFFFFSVLRCVASGSYCRGQVSAARIVRQNCAFVEWYLRLVRRTFGILYSERLRTADPHAR